MFFRARWKSTTRLKAFSGWRHRQTSSTCRGLPSMAGPMVRAVCVVSLVAKVGGSYVFVILLCDILKRG